MRLSSLNPLNLTLVLVTLITLATLAQPASASSLYHETCTGACNGAYAHCCAHVTGVIGESELSRCNKLTPGASQAGATARVVAACSLAQATCLQACANFFS